ERDEARLVARIVAEIVDLLRALAQPGAAPLPQVEIVREHLARGGVGGLARRRAGPHEPARGRLGGLALGLRGRGAVLADHLVEALLEVADLLLELLDRGGAVRRGLAAAALRRDRGEPGAGVLGR